MWPIIHQDILAQCDMLDGVADGILESPDLCNYDPSGLLCASGQNDTCLTATQVQTVRRTYAPLLDSDGSLIYPRLQLGAEATEAPFTLFTGTVFGSSDWFKYAILKNPSWDPMTLSLADMHLSSHLNLGDIDTWNGDLSPFKAKGGKLFHYHGLVDGVITSENSPRYYEHVSKTMGQSPTQLDDFYRFFRILGMSHCSGGPGASLIGNQARNSASLDPEENVLMAMVRWVEQGIAPEAVVGTRYRNGTDSSGVDFKRRHCKWPARNVYKGTGNHKNPLNWNCI
jgi:feruloyl esterase